MIDKAMKRALVVGLPAVNDQSDAAGKTLAVFSRLMDSKRFGAMVCVRPDTSPRLAATAHFEAADVVVCVPPGSRRACRTAAKHVAVPMFYWDSSVDRLVNDDGERDVPAVNERLTKTQLDRLHDGWCAACGAGDEYDTANDGELWYCLACPAQFEVTLGRRGGMKSATRVSDSLPADVWRRTP